MEAVTIETSSVKSWLLRFNEAQRTLELLRERLDLAETAAHSPRSAIPDGMPHGSGNPVDALGRTVAKLEKLRSQVAAAEIEANSLYEEIETAIGRIDGAQCAEKRAVLALKYLDLASWTGVNNALFGDKKDFLYKEDSFMRRTFYIHADALKKLGDILDAQKPAEAATRSELAAGRRVAE